MRSMVEGAAALYGQRRARPPPAGRPATSPAAQERSGYRNGHITTAATPPASRATGASNSPQPLSRRLRVRPMRRRAPLPGVARRPTSEPTMRWDATADTLY